MPDEMMQLLRQMQQTQEARQAATEQSLERFEALCRLDDHKLLAMVAWLLERQNAMLADRFGQQDLQLDIDTTGNRDAGK